MSRLSALPLRAKLRLIIMLTSSAALLLAVGVLFATEALTYRSEQRRSLEVRAAIMAANSAAAVAFDDPASALETANSLGRDPHMLQAAVYGKDGRLLASYVRPGAAARPPDRAPPDGHRAGTGSLSLAAPVRLRGERIGTVALERGLGEFYARLGLLAAAAALVLLAALGVAYALSERFQRVVSDPLLDLVDAAQGVTETHDYTRRVVKRGDDELGTLIDGFNTMLAEIEVRDAALMRARDELERRVDERTAELLAANKDLEAFNYSVSHDLRAPLRHIDSFSRLLEEEHQGGLDAQARDHLRRVRAAVSRMDRLIQGLLALAQASRGPLERRRVDLSALALEISRELKARQPERAVGFHIEPGLAASGDPALLRAALQNLLDNAWKFTSRNASARIEFGAEPRDGRTVYFVRDDGAGFDMSAAGKLFGAFQRLHPVGISRRRIWSSTRFGVRTARETAAQTLCRCVGVQSRLARGWASKPV